MTDDAHSYRGLPFATSQDAETLEIAYRDALRSGQGAAFAQAIATAFRDQPANPLLAAWHHRLAQPASPARPNTLAWRAAIPLAALNGLLFCLLTYTPLSFIRNPDRIGLLLAPIAGAFILLYLTIMDRRRWRRVVALLTVLVLVTASSLLSPPRVHFASQSAALTSIHLPLLVWAVVGACLLWRHWHAESVFAWLMKSLEALMAGALLGLAMGLFVGITYGLFDALGVSLSDHVTVMLLAGSFGVMPVLAVAMVYAPDEELGHQPLDAGLSPLVMTLMRLLLVPAFAVLLIYVAFIPFNFMRPFVNRDVLIIYNAMLFAVMVLLVGATPVAGREVAEKAAVWLRLAIVALAGLALVVGLYALTAIIYRTAIAIWTPNRLAFMGWNALDVGILGWLLIEQLRADRRGWTLALKKTLVAGAALSVAWAAVVAIGVPWWLRLP